MRVILPIDAACVDCGTVFAPDDLAVGKYRADPGEIVSILQERRAAQQSASTVRGKTGSYRDLGLPTWLQQPGIVPRLPGNVRDVALQSQQGAVRLSSIEHALGLVLDHPTIEVPTPVGPVTIDASLARKIASKTDSGHNQLLRVGLATLRTPREIWQDGEKWRFLSLYAIGSTQATQIAVVHRTGDFVYTIYEIDDSGPIGSRDPIEKRANRKRNGTCLYVAYID